MNKVQKLLLAFATASTVLSNPVLAEDNSFYLTAGGGLFMGSKITSNFKLKAPLDNQVKSKNPALGGSILAGVGYYAMENLRLEAVFVKPVYGKSKFTIVDAVPATASDKAKNKVVSVTPSVNSLQLRAYYDAFEFADMGKAYVGAGFGWANAKVKLAGLPDAHKAKSTNALAWTAAVGASFDVAEGIKLATEYNYQGFGDHKVNDKSIPKKASLNGHALLAKVMFSI